MNNLIKFAKEQCIIFPGYSEMGKFLRETMKMLQVKPCEDAVSRKDMYFKLTNGAYPNETTEQFTDRLVKELEELPPVTPTRKKGQKMDKIRFVQLTYTNGEKTYIKADTIVQLEEVGNATDVFTIGNDSPLYVKESVDEILAKIGGEE